MSVRAALVALLLLAGCAPGPGEAPPSPPVFVTIGPGGALSIGEQPTELNRVAADLKRLLGPGAEKERIFVKADGDVGYPEFMAVMKALQNGGFYKIALVGETLDQP